MNRGDGQYLGWVDQWKGLLIALVVIGHAVGGGAHLTIGMTSSLCSSIYRVIYTFHMPAFFVLAGFLWRTHDESLGSFIVRKGKRLLVPYWVFGLASLVLFACFNSNSLLSDTTTSYYSPERIGTVSVQIMGLLHGTGLAHGQGLRMNSVLWFLPCMFVVLLTYRLLRLDSPVKSFVALLVSYFLSLLDLPWWLPWGVRRAPEFLFFVILGHEFAPFIERALSRMALLGWGLLGLLFIVGIAVIPETELRTRPLLWKGIFMLFALIGVLLSAVLARSLRHVDLLRKLGMESMGIMLTHKFFVTFLEWKVPLVKRLLRAEWLIALGTILIISFLSIALSFVIAKTLRRYCPWSLGCEVRK